ncbi:TPA: DUF2184 domain-containing protein [Vibrio parahaemolyticus]|nr:DUF2184 domain-containing protein [Vibrio parahaemolyticus]HAV1545600.1 DUF2184 domain-containing protein [Vibrio parahaemolyticus]
MPAQLPVIPNVTLTDSSPIGDYQAFIVPGLTHIEQGVYKKKYPATSGYRGFLFVDQSTSNLAEFVARRSRDFSGAGGWDSTGNNAHHTPVEVSYDGVGIPIYQRSYPIRWNLFEIRQAAAEFNAGGGLNLKADKMEAIQDIAEMEKNLLAMFGDKTKNMEGMVNSEQVTTVVASMSIADLVGLITLDNGLQFVINYFAEFVNKVEFDQTNTLFAPNMIPVTPRDYRSLSQAVMPLTGESILPKLEKALNVQFKPELALAKGKFKPLPQSDQKFDPLTSDRMLIGKYRDKETARFLLPQDLTFGRAFPEDDQNFKQIARMRMAGTEYKIPKAFLKVDLPDSTKATHSLASLLLNQNLAFTPDGKLAEVEREAASGNIKPGSYKPLDNDKLADLGLIAKASRKAPGEKGSNSDSGYFTVTEKGKEGVYDKEDGKNDA